MSKKGILVIGLLILGLAMLVQFIFNLTNVGAEDMRLVNTNQSVSYAVDANPLFHSNDSRLFYFVTRTGIRYINDRGENRWTEQFNFTRPHMATRGDVVAIGESDRGRNIYVYNSEGLMYYEAFQHPTLGFFINANGYLSTILQLEGGFEVLVVNQLRSFEHLFRKQIFQADRPMEMPIATDVSEDGRFIAIAYLDLSRHLTTAVEFWFIDPNEVWGTDDGLFAQIEFPDETFISVRFMADNHVLLITEGRITLQQVVGNALQEVWTEELHNRLDQLAFYGNNRFAYVSGQALAPDGRYADPLGMLNIFDLSGRTGSFPLGRRATHLTMGHNAVIVGADRHFHAVNSRGTSLWHHNATIDVRDMIFLNDTDTVLIAGANRAYVWRRQRVRDGQPLQTHEGQNQNTRLPAYLLEC